MTQRSAAEHTDIVATVRAILRRGRWESAEARAYVDSAIAGALEVHGQLGDRLRDLLMLRSELGEEREVGR